MKILMIADCDDKYGAPHSLCQMAVKLLAKNDINITVILNHESAVSDFLRSHGCQVIIVHYSPFCIGYPENRWKLPFKILRDGVKYFYSRFFSVKRLQKLINIREYDLVHSNSCREDLGAIVAEQFNIPLVWHIREFGNFDYKFVSLRYNYISFINKTASIVIAISDAVKYHWISKGIDKQKILRIYNGVQIQDFVKTRVTPLNNKKEIKLVMAGSIQPTKGQIHAIELMASLKAADKKYSLDLIGDGENRFLNRLKELIDGYGLIESVKFLGYRNDVCDLLPNYDIGLICSKSEGFGRVTAEYMMAGLPVLASNTGANGELIREGIDGYLYSYGNNQDMKDKLLKIINNNLGGLETYRYAVDNFSDVVNAENVYQIYKKILQDMIKINEKMRQR